MNKDDLAKAEEMSRNCIREHQMKLAARLMALMAEYRDPVDIVEAMATLLETEEVRAHLNWNPEHSAAWDAVRDYQIDSAARLKAVLPLLSKGFWQYRTNVSQALCVDWEAKLSDAKDEPQ